jgi:hypothetical protein
VTSMTAVSNHFVESFVFLSQADYATTNDNVVRSTTWASLLRGRSKPTDPPSIGPLLQRTFSVSSSSSE